MDIASGTKNKDILKILLETNQKIKQHYLDMHKDVRLHICINILMFRLSSEHWRVYLTLR